MAGLCPPVVPWGQDGMLAPVVFSSSGQLCPEMSRDVNSRRDRHCVPLAQLSPAPGPDEHLLTLQPRSFPPSFVTVSPWVQAAGGPWPWLSHPGRGEAEATGSSHVSQT